MNTQASPLTLKTLVEEARREGAIVTARRPTSTSPETVQPVPAAAVPSESGVLPPLSSEGILVAALIRSAAQARKWALEGRGHWSLS